MPLTVEDCLSAIPCGMNVQDRELRNGCVIRGHEIFSVFDESAWYRGRRGHSKSICGELDSNHRTIRISVRKFIGNVIYTMALLLMRLEDERAANNY
jgi:hypothetical protein